MIRPARFADIPDLMAMLREMQAASKYAGRVEIVEKAAESLLLGMIAGQNQSGLGASFCGIAEEGGETVGFMAGVLSRVYFIGDRFTANDAYLYVRPGAASHHVRNLISAYIQWASGNPKVIEIKLSWTDAVDGAGKIARLYDHKGFDLVGEIYEMRLDAPAQEEAA